MLLRRITKHVKDQNWFAVLIDFAIVVVGVFIGIQVANWNEMRQDKILANDYLLRLHADMELSITATERTKNFISENTTRLGFVIDSLAKCELAEGDRDDFANGINHAGKLVPATFVTGTLEELLSSGRIGLIKNTEIRDKLNEASREISYQASIWDSLYARTRSLLDHIDEKAVIRIADQERRHGFGAATWQELDIEFTALCDDQKFNAAITLQERMGHVNIDWLDRNLRNFHAARDTIAQEIRLSSSRENN